jgi:regulator of sigma E protease
VSVSAVSQNSPASQAGLQVNDHIKKLIYQTHEYTIESPNDVVSLTKKYAGSPIVVIYDRGNKEQATRITPRKNPPKGEGSMGIGITNIETKKYPLIQAPYYALVESITITKTIAVEIISTLFKLVTLQKISGDIAGPIGVAQLTGQAVQYGYLAVFQLLGLLSFNLAIVNILPFPALDGGRLAMIIIEAVTRKKINAEIERKLNMAGFAILISLIVLISIHDIIKLIIK